jgi:hypothetical protein
MHYRVLSHRRTALLIGMAALCAATLYSQPNVLTWHNDNARTGQNLEETILTQANVNSSTFGKLFSIVVDGKVDGQPLYVPGLTIPGKGVHNVLYIATENDSVYAVDADNGAVLQQVTLLVGSETPSDSRSCAQVTPQIGITATPVIDPGSGPHGTIYVVAMSKYTNGNNVTYYQRLHALDLTTLAEEFNGPVEVGATISGSGDETTFLAAQHKDRAALLLANGIVYTTWSSHCDIKPYTSWVIGYHESNLTEQPTVLNLVPNGVQGGIWASGSGPQADGAGNIYVPIGNGTFDTALTGSGFPSLNDYGNAYVKISTSGGNLAVADYFTMFNTTIESGADQDLGSGGGLLLPPLNDTNGHSRNLAVAAGKDGNIYVMDTANLGKFNPSTDEIYQQLTDVIVNGDNAGEWGSPAWFNGTLYYGGEGNALMAFPFASGKFATSPASRSAEIFPYPGTTPSISANGTSNGIVWASIGNGSAALYAYNAANLADMLYNSNQAANGRDQFGTANKFVFPTIVNGKVYVASDTTTAGQVTVFGLLAEPPEPVSVSPNSGSGSAGNFAFAFSDPAGAGDIVSAQMDINATLVPNGACYFNYVRAANTIALANDSGSFQAPLTIGSAGTSQNSQCTIDAASSSVLSSGSTLTVTLAVSFAQTFGGAKNIYAEVLNSTLNSGWAALGTWTVPAGPPPPPPVSVSVTPNSGSGAAQTFVFAYSDSSGATDIVSTQMDINATLAVNGACYLYYVRVYNEIYLAGDTGAWQGPIPIGVPGTLENSQCTVNAGASSASASGNNLTVSLALSFTSSFAGAKNVYAEVRNATVDAGWVQLGAWTVPSSVGGAPSLPVAVSVTPNSGSASTQTFVFAYSDSNGATDIRSTQMDISATLAVNGACYLYYVRVYNEIYLASDTGVWQGPLTVGASGTLGNSQCTVNAGASSATASGNNLSVSLALSFTSAFAGAKNIYSEVENPTVDAGWGQVGTWTVPSSGTEAPPSLPVAVSVTPNSGSAATQTFVFAYSDSNGATDIRSTQMDIDATLAVNGACYLYYVRVYNEIYLAGDTGAWQGPISIGVAGTLQNSQCTVNAGASSASASGNNLSVSLALSFTSAFAGAKNIYSEVENSTVDAGWVQLGAWTVP